MIQGNWTCPVEDQEECQGRRSQWKFIAMLTGQSVMPMHLPDGHSEINQNCECGHTGEKSSQQKQPTQKLRQSGDISQPSRKSETGHEMNMIVQMPKSILIAVDNHNHAQSQPGHRKGQWLQTVEIAQRCLQDDSEVNRSVANKS
jgi:hypothetical protein